MGVPGISGSGWLVRAMIDVKESPFGMMAVWYDGTVVK